MEDLVSGGLPLSIFIIRSRRGGGNVENKSIVTEFPQQKQCLKASLKPRNPGNTFARVLYLTTATPSYALSLERLWRTYTLYRNNEFSMT